MLAGIEAAGLTLPRRCPEKWVVDGKSVGSGEKALIYLGRYLYRGVVAENDIVACDNAQVSFRYRNAKTGKRARRTVPGAHFLWLVLQHVLPKGFRRARNFGFLHPNCKRALDRLAEPAAEVRPCSGDGMVQGTRPDPMHVPRGGDGDRENAHSVGVLRDHARAYCPCGDALIR